MRTQPTSAALASSLAASSADALAPARSTSPNGASAKPRWLQLPCPSSGWRYARAYWAATLVNLLRPHRIQTATVGSYSAPVHISAALRAGWHALFGVEGDEATPPLLYNQGVGTLLYTQVFADLKINFRHLLHLDHACTHFAGASACAQATRQVLKVSLQAATRVGDRRAVVTLRTMICRPDDEGGAVLAQVDDRFLVRGLPKADVAALPADRGLRSELLALRRRTPAIVPTSSGGLILPLPLASDLGQRYGAVAGDRNPVHTRPLVARLFGVKRCFAQGLALRNAVVCALARHGVALSALDMHFLSPAYLGQVLQLRADAGYFELVDEAGQLVAFGRAA